MLDLTLNGISELPAEVGQLVHLSKLYLDRNRLTRLPHELHKLSTTLTLLGISNNPLEQPLMQLYYAGLPILLAHLKATRPRRTNGTSSPTRSVGGDVVAFNLFDTALPDSALRKEPLLAARRQRTMDCIRGTLTR